MTTPQPKFSVGQRVRVVRETVFHFGNYVGREGAVESVYPKNECAVLFDGYPPSMSIVFREDELSEVSDDEQR